MVTLFYSNSFLLAVLLYIFVLVDDDFLSPNTHTHRYTTCCYIPVQECFQSLYDFNHFIITSMILRSDSDIFTDENNKFIKLF
eukprot:UN09543